MLKCSRQLLCMQVPGPKPAASGKELRTCSEAESDRRPVASSPVANAWSARPAKARCCSISSHGLCLMHNRPLLEAMVARESAICEALMSAAVAAYLSTACAVPVAIEVSCQHVRVTVEKCVDSLSGRATSLHLQTLPRPAHQDTLQMFL